MNIVGLGTSKLCKFTNNHIVRFLKGSKKGKIAGKSWIGSTYVKYDPSKHKEPLCENVETGEKYHFPYKRILIQRIKK